MKPTRLAEGGRLLDRSETLTFRFNGETLTGHPGDTLASALLANGRRLLGRSFKYHRPRSVVASGAEEPNALMGLGTGARFEPNQRATVTELFDGLEAISQNHWPSLAFDIGQVNAALARFLPAGFYYKTFIQPRAAWKHLFEPVIRQSAGLGRAPSEGDADRYEYLYAMTDVLVVGGGMAGLAAAQRAAADGSRVMLLEQSGHWGGRLLSDPIAIDGTPGTEWVEATVGALSAQPNVTLRNRTMVAGLYDHGYALALERVSDHAPGADAPRHRLWRIRAGEVIVATGAIERPLSFAGNDKPGVMLASAVRDYLQLWGVAAGERTLVVTNNDDAYRTALALHDAGLAVPLICDARPKVEGALPAEARARGLRIAEGTAIAGIQGLNEVISVDLCGHTGDGLIEESVHCDVVAMSGGWSPAVHLWSHAGGKLAWDEATAAFRPDPERAPTGHDGAPFVSVVGSANGHLASGPALADAAGAEIPVDAPEEAAMAPVWLMPAHASRKTRAKAFLDFQNDVKVSDVELAAQEGFANVEHAKRYTTLGMATDQGKLSNINGLAILADARGLPIPQVGTTTFRPPYTPISLGAVAGEARGPLFKPLRKTAMDEWHDANGAVWEPVADWRRPYTYRRAGETTAAAVAREILATRRGVGMLDASTLGKILVTGPDAGRFLDLVYTNMMSTLKVGRCRYGLMCTENGFLFDDGVVARLSDDSFLCHTTTGGSDRVHAWMEEWLQTEWWDLKVFTANLTEQYAQVAVVGPKAREVLAALGGDIDLSAEALPFMGWAEGMLGGIPARVFRISFSGELSYEVAVPAGQGQAFWDAVRGAGAAHGITPYGTEALHVMRAEKGFIMIGDETDGTVTPHDLGLSWAVSKKKDDFIGRRAMQRADLSHPDRLHLVGLLTEDPQQVLPDGAHAAEGELRPGVARTIGHVTSTYFSPTLGRSIAMGLIRGGRRRMGDWLTFPVEGGRTIRARIADPVFYDPEGSRQNV
ncbi:MAG: sarcosine oxidase subunit alpha family protein [Pseudomonadota bacterium]